MDIEPETKSSSDDRERLHHLVRRVADAARQLRCMKHNGHAIYDGYSPPGDVVQGTYADRLAHSIKLLGEAQGELEAFRRLHPRINLGGLRYRVHTNF